MGQLDLLIKGASEQDRKSESKLDLSADGGGGALDQLLIGTKTGAAASADTEAGAQSSIVETVPAQEEPKGLFARAAGAGKSVAKKGLNALNYVVNLPKRGIDAAGNALSETTMFKEAAEGFELADQGKVQGDALMFAGEELMKGLSSPAVSFLNIPKVSKGLVFVGENSSNIPLKTIAALDAIGKDTYDDAYAAWLAERNDQNNPTWQKFLYELQDSGVQSAIGVALSLSATALTRSPAAGYAVSGAYYTAISANEQIQKDGKVTSGVNVGIDVVGDQLMNVLALKIVKEPSAVLWKSVTQSMGIEGSTEVAQSLMKYSNDYANARTEEEKQKILAEIKQYVKGGGMAMEFSVGAVSGGIIGGTVNYVGGVKTNVNSSLQPRDATTKPKLDPNTPPDVTGRTPITEDVAIGTPQEIENIRDEVATRSGDPASSQDQTFIEKSDALTDYAQVYSDRTVYIPSKTSDAPLVSVSVLPFPDGKFALAFDANTDVNGVSSAFDFKQLFDSPEAATKSASDAIVAWARTEMEGAQEARERAQYEEVIAAVTKPEASVPAEVKPTLVTDPADVQEIKNSIAEGESILASGKSATGRKMSEAELGSVRRAVENSRRRIYGEESKIKVGDTVEVVQKYLTQDGKSEIGTKGRVVSMRGKDSVNIEFGKTENGKPIRNVYLLSTLKKVEGQKTQKEKVKEIVEKKGEANIKEIAQETGILEPNVRRILGVGAKEGTFERVAEGVYTITKDGEKLAYVIPADAIDTLPKLAAEGFKADMVFLDIPYDTPAVKGGSRGVKYDLVSTGDFSKILDSVKIILRSEDSPVIHMFSNAPSGMKAMQKYNDLFPEKGFVPVGKGAYQKTYADGSPVGFPSRKGFIITEPEGILVFTQSGNLKKDLGALNFKLVRPKGYATEKPAAMMKALIEMTTEEGDVVFDPFTGSGVVPAEAVKTGRKAVAIEKIPEQAARVAERVQKAADERKSTELERNPFVVFKPADKESTEEKQVRLGMLADALNHNNDTFATLGSSTNLPKMYHGENKTVFATPAETKNAWQNILVVKNDQKQLLEALANTGDVTAKEILGGLNIYRDGDARIATYARAAGFDAIEYRNTHIANKGIEVMDLKTGLFHSEHEAIAKLYAMQARYAKYEEDQETRSADVPAEMLLASSFADAKKNDIKAQFKGTEATIYDPSGALLDKFTVASKGLEDNFYAIKLGGWKLLDEGVVTDSHLLVVDKENADAEKRRLAVKFTSSATTYQDQPRIDWEQIIWKGGEQDAWVQGYAMDKTFGKWRVAISDGEKRAFVDADKYAYVRKVLPNARLVMQKGTEESNTFAKLMDGDTVVGMIAPLRDPNYDFDLPLEAGRPSQDVQTSAGEEIVSKTTEESPEAEATQGEAVLSVLVGIDDIPKDVARNAYYWSSMDPERRGEGARQDYVEHLARVVEEITPLANTPEKVAIAQKALDAYKAGYLKRELALLSARSKTASSAVTGAANFPVEKNRKAINREMALYDEKKEWSEKFIKRLKNELNPTTISSDDVNAVDKLNEKLAKAEELHQNMLDMNVIIRKNKDKAEAKKAIMERFPEVSEKGVDAILNPSYGKAGFHGYQLTNSNARIRQMKDRIDSLEKAKTADSKEYEIAGVKVTEDVEDNRLRLHFDGKPEPEMIAKLKSNGFKWSPFNKAWQRQLTNNARYSLKLIFKEDQPKTPSGYAQSIGGGVELTEDMLTAAKLPESMGGIDAIRPIELPELVEMARNIMGRFPDIVKKSGDAAGRFYGQGDGRIKIIAQQFKKGGNVMDAVRTLSHELGHLADYIEPDKTLDRGNILGRIASLRHYMAETFGSEGKFPDERKKQIRNEETKAVLEDRDVSFGDMVSGKLDKEVAKEIRLEISKRAKARIDAEITQGGYISNKAIRKELLAVTRWWHPYDPANVPQSYKNYRESSVELYAEAVSVLFSAPNRLQSMAPTFYEAWFKALDQKPSVRDEFFAVQAMLSGDRKALVSHRQERVVSMFKKGDTEALDVWKREQMEKEQRKRNYWKSFKHTVIDLNLALSEKFAALEKSGQLSPDENPAYLLEERNYLGGKVRAIFDRDFNHVYQNVTEAGIPWTDFGQFLFYTRIIAGDRTDAANPLGITPDAAQELLDKMIADYGDEAGTKMQTLVGASEHFRNAVKKIAKDAYDAGLYSKELYESMEKNPAYATFQVIDHLEDKVTSTVYKSIGTLKEIVNPADSTMLKVIATIRATERNRVVRENIKGLEQFFPDDVEEAAYRFNGKVQEPRPPKKAGLKLVTFKEEGQTKGYYVDPYIAETLDNTRAGADIPFIPILRFMNSTFYRPLFITYNLGFQSFNLIRDFRRFYKNTPDMTLGRAFKRYAEAGRLAKVRAFGVGKNPSVEDQATMALLDQLQEERVLGMTFNQMIGSEDVFESQVEKILAETGIDAFQPKRRPLPRGFRRMGSILTKTKILDIISVSMDFIENMGNFIETLPKAAGVFELQAKTGRLDAAQRSFIRRKIGSPDFLAAGKYKPATNEVFLFSNSIIQGIRADIEVASDPTTRSGYWWKTVKIDLFPKLLMFAALSGFLGEGLKKLFEKVSEYDMTNYTIIPLGVDENGKAIYFRLPHDESSRFISGVLWKALNIGSNEQSAVRDLTDVLSYTGGQIPSLSPTVQLIFSGTQFAAGQNPYDFFRGRNVLSDDAFKAGGSEAAKEYAGWMFQELGGGIFYRFYHQDLPPKEQSAAERAFNMPITGNIVGRFLRASDYGEIEKLRGVQKRVESEEAAIRLADRKIVNDYVRKAQEQNIRFATTKLENEMVKEALGKYPTTTDERRRAQKLVQKFRISFKRGGADANVVALIDADSNKQKVEILKTIREDLSDAEWASLRRDLLRNKVISEEVIQRMQYENARN